jgi:RNA polymerase sigma-70 factor (ECF subfamily)
MLNSEPSKEALLAKAMSGDKDTQTALLREYGPQVRQRLVGKIAEYHRGAFDEDDVMQVTYLEAFLRFGQFSPRGSGSFLAWLTRIAENNLRDAVKELERAKRPPRTRQVKPKASDESYVTLVEILGATLTTPSRHAAAAEARQLLDRSIEKLPPDYREVIRQHDLEARSAKDVAKEMGRSIGAVYMLRARALEALVEMLPTESNFFTKHA